MGHLSGKRILITQSTLVRLSGSEIVTLELAEYFRSQGADVFIYTNMYADPIKSYVEQLDSTVVTDASVLSDQDFDFVWVHHQILPPSLLIDKPRDKRPIFIFYHMSPIHAIEFSYIHELEQKLSSLSLYTSVGTLKEQRDRSPTYTPQELLPNMIPPSFQLSPRDKHKLRKILVVSNHPPSEVHEAMKILLEKGYKVDDIGNTSKASIKRITPDILMRYDVVVTIGKTVQYCMGLNIPAYIYDHFGGPGYLCDSNYEIAKKTTFSGRLYFSKKDADVIATEIVEKFDEAVGFQSKSRQRFIEEYSMQNLMEGVFSRRFHPAAFRELGDEYFKYLTITHDLVKEMTSYSTSLMLHYSEAQRLITELNSRIESECSKVGLSPSSKKHTLRRIIGYLKRVLFR